MILYPRLVVAPEIDPESLTAALAGIHEDSPGVRRVRCERHTTHFWLKVGSRRLFIKRYRPPLERNVFTFAARSRAEREYDNSRFAARLGLNVVPAIAFGERRQWSIVVDQMIAFEDISPVKSVIQLLERASDRDEIRREVIPQFAADVARMHELGYSHLALSPRNYLRVGSESSHFVVIDHNSAVAFEHSILGRTEAIADLLNLFDSQKLFPSEAWRSEFLRHYAPNDSVFAGRVEHAIRSGTRSSAARRIQLVKNFFKPSRVAVSSREREHA